MTKTEFNLIDYEYSKKLSECKSGAIVAKQGKRMLLVEVPSLCEKEKKFFEKVLEEMRHVGKAVITKADIYFF